LELSEAARPYQLEEAIPSTDLTLILARLCNFRVRLKDGLLTDPAEILFTATAIDNDLALWQASLPDGWSYTQHVVEYVPEAYDGQFFIYPSTFISLYYNSYRSARIIVNEIILSKLDLEANGSAAVFTKSRDTVVQMASEICASSYFHINEGGLSQPGSSPPMAAGMLLIWPLFAAASSPYVSLELRLWVSRTLSSLAKGTGIRLAFELSWWLDAMINRSSATPVDET
jgi:hypothetical protein